LVDLLGPGSGLQFRQHLPPSLELGGGPVPLDFEQSPEELGDWLARGDVLPTSLVRAGKTVPTNGWPEASSRSVTRTATTGTAASCPTAFGPKPAAIAAKTNQRLQRTGSMNPVIPSPQAGKSRPAGRFLPAA
jgi:hypothetical protein